MTTQAVRTVLRGTLPLDRVEEMLTPGLLLDFVLREAVDRVVMEEFFPGAFYTLQQLMVGLLGL